MTLNLWTFAQGFLQPWAPISLVLWRTCNYLTHPWDLIRCCILGEILSTSTGNDPSSLILFVDYFPQDFSLHFVSFSFSFVHYWVNLWVITHLSSHCLEPGSSNHHLTALKWTWAARASALVLEHSPQNNRDQYFRGKLGISTFSENETHDWQCHAPKSGHFLSRSPTWGWAAL